MKKYLLLLIIISPIFLSGCDSNVSSASTESSASQSKPVAVQNEVPANQPMSISKAAASKVQVFLFHATQRCTTCTAIGRLAGETVNERFSDELKTGKIEFREVNVDLPENRDLARKFGASGSSLFLNAITNGEDNIAEDTRVWRLTSDPTAFKAYLEDKLNTMLGK